MATPEPPVGVRMILPDDRRIPLTVDYSHCDPEGMHWWTARLANADDALAVWTNSAAGLRIETDQMPGRTSLTFETPLLPEGFEATTLRGSYSDEHGKRHIMG